MCREQLKTASGTEPRCDPREWTQQWEPTELNSILLPALTHCVIAAPLNYIFLLQLLHFAEWHLVTSVVFFTKHAEITQMKKFTKI